MIEPLRLAFEVECPVEHAFEVWTAGIGLWWPADHSVAGEADLQIVLEPGVGGRIYERTGAGAEHEWGEVTIWSPPDRLAYLWHLRRDRADATEVDIAFERLDPALTRVTIEHRGWEQLGADAESWRDRNQTGWQTLVPHYLAAIATVATTDRKATP